ncbi:hypothetical protein LXA47_15530 [Massilia sp. P8910]|uniref:hypothetical protein n=1 Tax=Massilia antarctica TaxID=2765360 RepID=UPI001E5B3044|nr:hypothetical protein [Massilia antarctica]MCE3605014.1 hypothetical protein [Massilia antarctica]
MPDGASVEWFRENLKLLTGKPRAILNLLRNSVAEIRALETKNAFKVNLWALVVFSELLRHIIVHNSGRTGDRATLLAKVFADAGLSRSGQDEFHDFMESFFGTGEYGNSIVMLEMLVGDSGLGIHRNGLDELSRYLMAYAHLMSKKID